MESGRGWKVKIDDLHTNDDFLDMEKIINLPDKNGKESELVIVTSNRSSGKTVGAFKALLSYAVDENKQCMYLFRTKAEISGCELMFNDVLSIYPDLLDGEVVTSKNCMGGLFYELSAGDYVLGYAAALNSADKLKKYSGVFVNVRYCLLDEYETSDGKYLKDEIGKLQNIVMTISRGGGDRANPVKTILLGNNISDLNPYAIAFGLYKYLSKQRQIIYLDRIVAVYDIIDKSAKDISSMTIISSAKTAIGQSSIGEGQLTKTDLFIGKATVGKYLFTVLYDGDYYGVRSQGDKMAISLKHDPSAKKYCFRAIDHDTDVELLDRRSSILAYASWCYRTCNIIFADLKCKQMFLDMIGTNIF